jgi:hypothetical protein
VATFDDKVALGAAPSGRDSKGAVVTNRRPRRMIPQRGLWPDPINSAAELTAPRAPKFSCSGTTARSLIPKL